MHFIIQNQRTSYTCFVVAESKEEAIAYMYKNLDMHDTWTCNHYTLPDTTNIPY